MLKQRILTAALLIPLTVWAIFGLSNLGLGLVLALLVLVGAWEWSQLAGLRGLGQRLLYLVFIGCGMWGGWLLIGHETALLGMLLAALAWWLFGFAWVLRFHREGRRGATGTGLKCVGGFLTLVPAWTALIAVHADKALGPGFMLFVLVLMWVADSGAYFAGRYLGRHKLAPAVSPGKTWEGVYGALAVTVVLAAATGYAVGFAGEKLLGFALLCVITVCFSVVGDLLESLLKRERGLKDSGALFPGHGGVLDRVDSITAGAPMFLLGMTLLRGLT